MDRKIPPDDAELVGSSPSQRNWKGIAIALLVIVMVCSLIVLAVILVTPMAHDKVVLGEPFSFEDIFDPEFKPRQFSAEWADDNNIYTYWSRSGELLFYDAEKNISHILMDNSTFRKLGTETAYVSPDLNYVLIAINVRPVFRHSTLASYVIYERYTGDGVQHPIKFPESAVGDIWQGRDLQYASWSPKGHSLTFVYENNLYYQASPITAPTQITTDGLSNIIFNGIPDWLYEEEILHSNTAHWWSPESTYIAFIQFNDTNVPWYRIPFYGDGTSTYGYLDNLPYPKAGDIGVAVNPIVKLYVALTANVQSHRYISPPKMLAKREHYITLVQWRDNKHLLVGWSNRAQNQTIMTLWNVEEMDSNLNLIENSYEGRGWVAIEKVKFIDGGRQYLTILPQNDGAHGYWYHVARINCNMQSEGQRVYVTHGRWDVHSIVGYNDSSMDLYFISSKHDPRTRHLYRQNIRTRGGQPVCLTCDDPKCQYVSASMSHNEEYYILNCQGPDVPSTVLRRIDSEYEIVLEDNIALRTKLEKKSVPIREFFQFEVEPGLMLHGEMWLPPRLNKEHITQYPLLIHTYGGPNTQLVTKQFHIGWATYLSSSQSVIYASIDGRGSSARGLRFLHANYRNLGSLEVQDQIAGAKYLNDTFKYVDKKRSAIWGWSYGGFVTIHAIGDEKQNVLKCGIAVAPVTDWRYYDTAYTERYMGFASSHDNYRGYDNANGSRLAGNFKGKDFMVVHGTADDNVHFQHTAQFTRALTEADVDYRIQVYADNNHALARGNTERHLYRTMTSFLKKDCWKGGEPRDVRPTDSTPISKS